MNCKRNLTGALALGVALVLGGCGGGGGGGGDASNGSGGANASSSIPSSATASVDAFVAYLKLQIAGTNETSSPVTLGDAVGPTSDTATPVGL